MMINKEPVYIQINRALRQLIIIENYSTGDKFLTERALCDQFNVSRSTANKSLSSLVSENILEFKKGIGTFIKSIPDRHDSYSLFRDPIELLNNQNENFSVEIIKKETYSDSQLSECEQPLSLIRKIWKMDKIIAVEEVFSKNPHDLFPKNHNHTDSLISLLNRNNHIFILETSDSLRSRISLERDKELFENQKEFPMLEIISEIKIGNVIAPIIVKTKYNADLFSMDFNSEEKTIKLHLLE